MCKIQIDEKVLPFSEPAKWEDVESIISQELSQLSPCARIVSVTIETTTDLQEKVLMEERRKRKAEDDKCMAERRVNYVKTGIK